MLVSIEGIYRDGKVELMEQPDAINNESKVIVTFISPEQIDLSSVNISKEQAQELRQRLSTFAEDWNNPDMDIYDHYEKSKTKTETG